MAETEHGKVGQSTLPTEDNGNFFISLVNSIEKKNHHESRRTTRWRSEIRNPLSLEIRSDSVYSSSILNMRRRRRRRRSLLHQYKIIFKNKNDAEAETPGCDVLF